MEGDVTTTISTIVDLMKTGGALAALTIGVWAFYTGKIMPDSVVERIINESRQQTEILATKICKEMRQCVTEGVNKGIVKGILEIRNNPSKDDGQD